MQTEFCIVARNAANRIQRCIYVDHKKQGFCSGGCPVAMKLRPDGKVTPGLGGTDLKVKWLK